MFKHTPIFHQLFVTIELKTPMAIGQGYGETGFDMLLMRDANGLPTIPGSSLAGMLRAQFEKHCSQIEANALFGAPPKQVERTKNNEKVKEPVISNFQFGFAHVHNKNNESVLGLQPDLIDSEDPIIQLLLEDHPIVRERVSLSDKGTALDTGKYDVSAVPKGTRFTFEISAWFSEEQPQPWCKLVEILCSGTLRAGRNKQSGFGAFDVVQLNQAICDMTKEDDRERFNQLALGIGKYENVAIPKTVQAPLCQVTFQSDGLLRMGGNGGMLGQLAEGERQPDMLTQVEKAITWPNNQAELTSMVVIPGSAIKGALRHRFTFHINRIEKRFTREVAEQGKETDLLFGFAKEKTKDAKDHADEGQAGRLLINDVFIPVNTDVIKPLILQHNAIDRFTGGTIDGALYSEQGLWDINFQFEIHLQNQKRQAETLSANEHAALVATLDDLVNGLLPLGAGGSRGNGSANADMSHHTLRGQQQEQSAMAIQSMEEMA